MVYVKLYRYYVTVKPFHSVLVCYYLFLAETISLVGAKPLELLPPGTSSGEAFPTRESTRQTSSSTTAGACMRTRVVECPAKFGLKLALLMHAGKWLWNVGHGLGQIPVH